MKGIFSRGKMEGGISSERVKKRVFRQRERVGKEERDIDVAFREKY